MTRRRRVPYLRQSLNSADIQVKPLNLYSIRHNEPSQSADKVGQLTQLIENGSPLHSTGYSNPAKEHQQAATNPRTPGFLCSCTWSVFGQIFVNFGVTVTGFTLSGAGRADWGYWCVAALCYSFKLGIKWTANISRAAASVPGETPRGSNGRRLQPE